MLKRVLLITSVPIDHWAHLINSVAEEFEASTAITRPDLIDRLDHAHEFDVVLVDSTMILRVEELITDLRRIVASWIIIVFAPLPDWQQARRVFLAGADDYRYKSHDRNEVVNIMGSALGKT